MSIVIYIDDFNNLTFKVFGGRDHCTAFVRCLRCNKDVLPHKVDKKHFNPVCIYCSEKEMQQIEKDLTNG